MVRFIRQGEKRRGERRKFRTKEQLCGEQRWCEYVPGR